LDYLNYGPLVGAWNFADQVRSLEVILRPDGRYPAVGVFAGARLDERGKYKVDIAAGKITFDPRTEETQMYEMDLYGNTMTLEDGRRVMLWGKKLYGRVDWENEALRRTQGK
jgi:hypothetical protein